jgi:hypothetical protein
MRRLGAGAMLVPEASANGASAICYMRDGRFAKSTEMAAASAI